MSKYIRLCAGTWNQKGKLIPADEDIYEYIKTLDKDSYKSIYYYNQKHFDQFDDEIVDESTGEVKRRGVSGVKDVVTNKLLWDFDSADVGAAKDDTITLCSRLISMGINKEAIQIFFSGGKGFGVELDTNHEFTESEFRNVVRNIAGDLKTFDPKIWNASRLIRIPYTKHQETGLYKIPLMLDELTGSTVRDIMEEAKHKYEVSLPATWAEIKLPEAILKYKHPPKEAKKKQPTEVNGGTIELDFSDKPRWLSKWKYAILNGYFPPGTRHYALLILAATCKNQGFPKDVTHNIVCGALDLHIPKFDSSYTYDKKKIYDTIINSVYGPMWQGGTFSEQNFPDDLIEYFEENGLPLEQDDTEREFVTINDVFEIFDDYATNINQNTIKLGVKGLDDIARITTSMLVGIIGAPGTGKTSLALKAMEHISANGENSCFYSLDMAAPLVYQKLAQRYTEYTPDQLLKIFENRDEEKKREIREVVSENFKNINITFKTAVNVECIKQDIINYQERTGIKVRLVVIDYLECLGGPYSDSTANTSYIAQKLKDLANDLGVCVMLLLQPSKRYGDPSEPVRSYRNIKGSSAIEQACSVIVGMWRDGFDPMYPEDDNFASFSVLKNRMGSLGQCDCAWNGLRGEVSELDQAGELELQELRKRKEMMKKLDDKEF